MQLIHGKHFGGAEVIVQRLAMGLDPERFRCTTVCLSEGRLLDSLREAGLTALHVPMGWKLNLTVLRTLVRQVRREKVDVINSHTGRTNFLARLAGKWAGAGIVNTVHSPISRDSNQGLSEQALNAWIDSAMSGLADCFVAVSDDSAKYLCGEGVPGDRITVVPNGTHVPQEPTTAEERRRARAEVGLPAEAFVVGMLAQLRPRKGPEHLIRAAREIVDKHPEALFVFVGDAEFVEKRNYLADLKRLACQCGVEEACRFVGFQSNTAQWVTAFDVMVLPSLFGEGLPLSLLEGMAHGLPIVTTDTEGNRCCVEDGRTGFLVPAADAGALAARLNELADSEPLRSEQGLAGFARARERFSIEAMLRGYEEVYEDLVEDRRSRRSAG